MMRAMVMDFGFDRNTLPLATQYMLGDSLLCAPIFSEDGGCEFYLPDCGTWTDILTGETLSGGKWYSKNYDYFSMPLYAKPDSIIVFGDFKGNSDYDYTDGMVIRIYGIADSHTAETTVYSSKGEPAVTVKAHRHGNVLDVTVSGKYKSYRVETPSQEFEVNLYH
jgi:alpha-D-xyloside xylohydrolase